jgi:hypothetical protein
MLVVESRKAATRRFFDALVKRSNCCHCEEWSDAAISMYQAEKNHELAEFIPGRKNEIASPSVRKDGV